MNVSIEHKDSSSAVITLAIEQADYAEKVEKALKHYRQTAQMPGFRKGMVPMSLVKKMYGKAVKAEEINRAVGQQLYTYISENKINVLGEPMPNEELQKEYDFDTTDDFEFVFDVAISPEVDVVIDKSIEVPFFNIEPEKAMIDEQIESILSSYGSYEDADEVEENDMLKGLLCQLEDGQAMENGILVEDASILPLYMKDEAEKAKFVGAKKNSVIVFNPFKAYDGNKYELSSLFKVERGTGDAYTGDFSFEIREISRHKKAELGEELYKTAFGAETEVKSEEEFREKVAESLRFQFRSESDYKFLLDLRTALENKVGEISFADPILKRWLLTQNPERDEAWVEEQFPALVRDLRYHVIKEDLVKKLGIEVSEEDLKSYAKHVARSQFAQYGMHGVEDEMLERFANENLLAKEDTRRGFYDRITEEKIASAVKGEITLVEETLSFEEFRQKMQGEETVVEE